jgi:hypothetical protein
MQDTLTTSNDEQHHIYISRTKDRISWRSLNFFFGRWILLIKGGKPRLAHLHYGHALLQDFGIREWFAVFAGRLATNQARKNQATKNAG